MLPVTRANLDHICCICLLDVRPSMFTKNVYDVKKENNMSKILKLSALITILKNPMNQKYIKDYCRKICEICLVKTQYFYSFREKIMSSTAMLKELLENSDLNEQDIERLQNFCRICSNRLKSTKDLKYLNMTHLKWLKDCSGIRFTSLIDTDKFRIKEGTNINEIAVINDTNFPRKLCSNCFKKLQNVEEFRKSATKSFEYMISVMGDASLPEDYLLTQQLKQYNESMVCRKEPQTQPVNTNCAKHDCAISEMNSFEYQKVQGLFCLDFQWQQDQKHSSYNFEYQTEQKHSYSDAAECTMSQSGSDKESVKNTPNNSSIQQLEYDTFEDVMELMDDLAQYSNNSEEDVTLSLNEFADLGDDENKSKCLRQARAKKFKQCNINNEGNTNSEAENEIKFKPKRRCNKIQKLSKNAKKLKENDKVSHDENAKKSEDDHDKEKFACEICSKIFETRSKCKKHQRTVHRTGKHECLICLKKFKRKSLLNDHTKAVHEKLRPFNCSYCPKTFSAKSSRRVHELTHTGDYPFVCNSCGKGFRQSSQLKIHSEIHTTNPELLCPICKRSQKSQTDFENHIQSHKDKRLQCPLCGKFFTRSHHLKDHHNAVHLKLRPFKCEFCELAFGDRKTRLIHEKSHKEDRPLTCSVCRSGFKTLFSLSRHINRFGHQTEDNQIKTKKTKSAKSITPYYTEKSCNGFEL